MSTPSKTPRLLAAAKEFNIGKSTLLEHLSAKGFTVNDSPAFKLSEDMYDALQEDFAQAKAVKQKSEAIALPRGGMLDSMRPKEDEEAAKAAKIKKAKKEAAEKEPDPVPEEVPVEEPAKEIPVEPEPETMEPPAPEPQPEPEVPMAEPEPEAPIAEEPVKESGTKAKTKKTKEAEEDAVPEPEHKSEPVVVESPVAEIAPAPEQEIELPVEDSKVEIETVEETVSTPATPEPDQHIKTNAPKLGGPNILGKINLDSLNQSTRPKKGAGKKVETKPVEKKKPAKKTITPAPPAAKTERAVTPPAPAPVAPTVAKVEPKPVVEEEKKEHIEMKAPQLSGPKIIGRIELPVSSSGSSSERGRRKRIPVKKTDNKPTDRSRGPGTPRSAPGASPAAGGPNRGGPNQSPAGAARGGRGRTGTPGNQEIDKKEIQKKIQETQARLAGGRGGRNQKSSKYRRDKRDAMAEKRAADDDGQEGIIRVTEFISVSELANLLNVSFAEVIGKCMGLGIMVSINQRLDAEVIELVSSEFGYEVEFINLEQESEKEDEDEIDDPADLIPRAPIVTIMGHVDHGKTSLLDYIRNANVVSGEAGGITQHIGAYRVTTPTGKALTFLDTPGHEAFTAMRARGAKVADIAIIVIAADDAIMPQTKEAISHAQAAGLPMIFALNKIDKEGANPEKIREQLSALNILVEEWGGKYQSQEVSAKKGINIDLLLEKIGLEAELLELQANPNRIATGSVIEASLDKGRGYVSTILVQNGTLNQGDMLVCGQYYGKAKAMFNERGQRVTQAGPSTPVQVLGLNGAPQAGEKFKMFALEDEAKAIANHRAQILREQGIRARKHLTLEEIGRRLALGNFKELPVIIKGDFDGSVEALSDSLQKLSTPEVAVNVVMKGVGAVTESDINLAAASDAIVIAFQVRPTAQASRLAEQENIEIRHYSIIYDAIDEIKSAMEGLLEPKVEKRITANVEVREVYKISGVGTIAGCYVLDGKIVRNSKINILRDLKVVYTGELASLKRFKDDVKDVNYGYECGLSVKNYNDLRAGDVIEGYEEVEVKRTLKESKA